MKGGLYIVNGKAFADVSLVVIPHHSMYVDSCLL